MPGIDKKERQRFAQKKIVDADRRHHDCGAEANGHHHHSTITGPATRNRMSECQCDHQFGDEGETENQAHVAAL